MIIFYNKKTGEIKGHIGGRIHSQGHLEMWIGNKEENDRIIINWKPIKEYKNEKGEIIARDYIPNHPQANLFFELDKKPSEIYRYKIDLKTKFLTT